MWSATVAELAGYLRREIAQRGWSQRKVMEKTGLSKGALTGILEDPNRVPELPTLQKLAEGFEVPLRRLLELCGYTIEEAEAAEQEVYGLTDEQRAFLRGLSPEKKATLIDLARRMIEE